MGYKLILHKNDGSESTRHYDDLDSLEYNAATCASSPNIISIVAKEDTPLGKPLFGWGREKKTNHEQTNGYLRRT